MESSNPPITESQTTPVLMWTLASTIFSGAPLFHNHRRDVILRVNLQFNRERCAPTLKRRLRRGLRRRIERHLVGRDAPRVRRSLGEGGIAPHQLRQAADLRAVHHASEGHCAILLEGERQLVVRVTLLRLRKHDEVRSRPPRPLHLPLLRYLNVMLTGAMPIVQ